jgi:hypothetical protein
MARVDRDFREVVVNNLLSVNKLLSENDIENDTAAFNRLVHTVNFLEDICYPYMNQGKPTTYNPKVTANSRENIHYRIRECIKIAKAVALMPPKRITDDATTFTPNDEPELIISEENI